MTISKEKFDIIRAEQGLSIKQLSKKAGISKTTLNNIGKKELSPLLVGKLARGLNIQVIDLIDNI